MVSSIAWLVIMVAALNGGVSSQETVQVDIHGVQITTDPKTGGLVGLRLGPDQILEATPDRASLVDLALPGHAFDPLRAGVRYSEDVEHKSSHGSLTLTWRVLGTSRAADIGGSIAASVRIEAAPDGRSLLLECTIENHSQLEIPQVIFPDLDGLLPFAGDYETELRTCGGVHRPFVELRQQYDDGRWYAARQNWLELRSGAYDKSMAARWLDYGSLAGGFSLFPKLWSWGPLVEDEPASDRVLLHLSQANRALRLMCQHKTRILPGDSWTSPEYVLTPHQGGWAKGIEPFREWIGENVRRPHAMPRHLRETLGYRSVWMAQQYAGADPGAPTVVWRFNDLPGLAEECRAHGLNEMVLWLWQPWEIPNEPSPELGTLEEFNTAIAQCREMGVNVSLFVSVMTLLDPIPARYGWSDAKEFWGYHTDFIPPLRPYYGKASRGSFADQADPKWQADVTSSLLHMIERGWTSITWDQALFSPNEPNIESIFQQVRAAARKRDPNASFAGEDLNNIDLSSRWLDYTWNWALFDEKLDWRPLVNAYPSPRFNVNIGTAPKTVKRVFMDHLFMNVLPSQPEGINGSARIADYPELSNALKTCAGLHQQFRDFFEDGLLIGDCILSKPAAQARVNVYVLPDRVLVVTMNVTPESQTIALDLDFAPWLESPSGLYRTARFNETGALLNSHDEDRPSWRETFFDLAPDEMAMLVVEPIATASSAP